MIFVTIFLMYLLGVCTGILICWRRNKPKIHIPKIHIPKIHIPKIPETIMSKCRDCGEVVEVIVHGTGRCPHCKNYYSWRDDVLWWNIMIG